MAAFTVCMSVTAASVSPALAFDFFGLFGGSKEEPPPVSPKTLPYKIIFTNGKVSSDLKTALRDISVLNKLLKEAPPDGDTLVARAEADLPRLIDALWGNGHYAGKVTIEIAGVPIEYGSNRGRAAALAAERYRGRAHVPVRVLISPGPLYHFAPLTIVDAATGAPVPQEAVPPKLYKDANGAPARTAVLIGAASRITNHYREQGHPYATIKDPRPVINHDTRIVQVALAVKPGPVAPIGNITVSGTKNVDPKVVRSFIYVEPGVMFSPKRLSEIRTSVSKIEAIGSVRTRPAEKLDPDGSIPVDVNVTERPPRVLGASARYSTTEGPAIRAYWVHRNLFGGAERLRLDASVFYLTTENQTAIRRKFDKSDFGAKLAASFVKPALGGSRADFHFDVHAKRDRTKSYTSRLANAVAAIRYRLGPTAWVQAGIEGEIGQTTDFLGQLRYGLVGLPVTANWDTTDKRLDPTRGFRIKGNVTPYKGFGDAPRFLFASRIEASTYYSLDEDSRYIIAGRVALASVAGGGIRSIPANRRLFAGGGGSVRGFEYLSLGPRDSLGRLVGGRSLFEASLEARIRITETIGIVPFVDAGTAFASSIPNFKEKIRFGAGLGLRYYTGIGPIRLDVATPLDRRKGERPWALYISLGQAF